MANETEAESVARFLREKGATKLPARHARGSDEAAFKARMRHEELTFSNLVRGGGLTPRLTRDAKRHAKP